MHTEFGSENLKVRDRSEDPGVGRRIILDWILGECGGKMWTGFISFRIGTTDRPL
jgi:hypothetical protein